MANWEKLNKELNNALNQMTDEEWKKFKAQADVKRALSQHDVSGSLHHPVKFGRWLLKYAKEGWDEGMLCWSYEGKFYNTDELYKVFCSQQ